MVAASSSHPTTEEPIRSMEEQCLRTQAVVADTARSKRRRQDEPPRRYDGDSPLSPPDSTLRTINNSRGDLPHTDRMHTYADSCLPEELGQLVTGASIQELESVFPEYISGAIRRDHSVDGDRMSAAITMNFPPRSIGDVACIMTLVVEPNKVERLAMLLFGAHLESDGGSREVVLQGGTRVRPHPQFLLQGSPSKAISEVFGLETAAAIAAAPYRKQEILMGTWATRCVTMTIYVEAHEPALINLNLGLKQGFKIHDKLYTSGEI
ncbi:hypothetical protein FLAG1_09973 [Fusarium langsethiae]|uniref:Uncharacterized protein n=1 Tax=Fusarium langsethiae TaxID=179993 RepID=A0A0N0V572_FUSLA|nr:hypothetical protein FLAG1_09973 [Fusarium langsethiae]